MAEVTDELVARLEAASVGSLALDSAILARLGFTWRGMNYWNSGNKIWTGPTNPTRSLDAALALAERVLPGWNWTLLSERERIAASDDPRPFAGLKRRGPLAANEGYASASAATPALALCLAILKATTATQTGDNGHVG